MKTNLSTEQLIRLLEALNSPNRILSQKEGDLKEKVIDILDTRFYEQSEDEDLPAGNGESRGGLTPLQGGIDTPF